MLPDSLVVTLHQPLSVLPQAALLLGRRGASEALMERLTLVFTQRGQWAREHHGHHLVEVGHEPSGC